MTANYDQAKVEHEDSARRIAREMGAFDLPTVHPYAMRGPQIGIRRPDEMLTMFGLLSAVPARRSRPVDRLAAGLRMAQDRDVIERRPFSASRQSAIRDAAQFYPGNFCRPYNPMKDDR